MEYRLKEVHFKKAKTKPISKGYFDWFNKCTMFGIYFKNKQLKCLNAKKNVPSFFDSHWGNSEIGAFTYKFTWLSFG
jgi:hypothetical protein